MPETPDIPEELPLADEASVVAEAAPEQRQEQRRNKDEAATSADEGATMDSHLTEEFS